MAANRYYIKASFEAGAEVYDETKSLLTACRWLRVRNYKPGTVVMDLKQGLVLSVRGGKYEAIAAQKFNNSKKKQQEEGPSPVVRPEAPSTQPSRVSEETKQEEEKGTLEFHE